MEATDFNMLKYPDKLWPLGHSINKDKAKLLLGIKNIIYYWKASPSRLERKVELELRDVALLKRRLWTICLYELPQVVQDVRIRNAAANGQRVAGAETIF